MQRLRRALPVLIAIGTTWLLTTASGVAQSSVPAFVYLRDSQGQLWFTGRDGAIRAGVPLYPASDEEIAAIPASGHWLIPKPDGSGLQAGPRPAWDLTNTTAQPSAQPPLASPAEPITLSGERGENTRPFELRGGNYTVAWRAQLRRESTSCFAGATLYRVDGKRHVETLFNVTLNRDHERTASGETQVYGVVAGAHYLDVSSTACSWSVEIRPL